MIKELANESEGIFECFEEVYRKVQNLFRSNRKRSKESVVTISSKIKFINSTRFMATSLLNLVDNHTEEIHKIICKECDCF